MLLGHEMPYLEVDTVRCRFCKCIQPFGLQCANCNVVFGLLESSCLICKRVDFKDANTQPSYHCNECQRCYSGLKQIVKNGEIILQNQHCKKCNICYGNLSYSRHICSMDMVFPVCYDSIRNSPLVYCVPKCGHVIHEVCEDKLIKNHNYQCPICRKLII